MLPEGLNWLCYFAGSSKSHRENSISFIFLESTHQVDMKNVVKSSKHFFGYFNTLETHNDITIFYSATSTTYLFFSLFNLGNGTAILELLLNAGADLNAITAWGDTAAHYAALTGKTLAKPFSSRIAIFMPP